jgi:hypothetical protein
MMLQFGARYIITLKTLAYQGWTSRRLLLTFRMTLPPPYSGQCAYPVATSELTVTGVEYVLLVCIYYSVNKSVIQYFVLCKAQVGSQTANRVLILLHTLLSLPSKDSILFF